MRTIKFRGKRIDNGEWVYGDLEYSRITDAAFIHTYYPDTKGYAGQLRVTTNTVGQFTGFLDKNGKEIYEGDIIESHSLSGDIARHRIGFDESMGCYIATLLIGRQAGYFFQIGQKWLIECGKVVTGNVYDNPEQTKGGKQ